MLAMQRVREAMERMRREKEAAGRAAAAAQPQPQLRPSSTTPAASSDTRSHSLSADVASSSQLTDDPSETEHAAGPSAAAAAAPMAAAAALPGRTAPASLSNGHGRGSGSILDSRSPFTPSPSSMPSPARRVAAFNAALAEEQGWEEEDGGDSEAEREWEKRERQMAEEAAADDASADPMEDEQSRHQQVAAHGSSSLSAPAWSGLPRADSPSSDDSEEEEELEGDNESQSAAAAGDNLSEPFVPTRDMPRLTPSTMVAQPGSATFALARAGSMPSSMAREEDSRDRAGSNEAMTGDSASPAPLAQSSSPASSPFHIMRMHQQQQQPQAASSPQIGGASVSPSLSSAPPARHLWMSVYRPQKHARIGVAYFSLDDETLFGGEYASMDAVIALKHRLMPDQIVTTSIPGDELFQQLTRNELDPRHPFSVRPMKRHEFTTESAIQRLRLLQVEEITSDSQYENIKDLTKLEHSLLLKSAIDFSKTSMVCAMGGLVLFLLSSSIFSQLEAERLQEPISIKALGSIPDADVLEVDAATMQSLGIFVHDPHPARAGSTYGKEGFSVFNVLKHTRTANGGRLLREWFMYPSTHMETILRRQDHIRYFTEPENTDLVGELRNHLRHLKDLVREQDSIIGMGSMRAQARLLQRFGPRLAKRVEWRSLVGGLTHLLAIGQLLRDRIGDLPLFVRVRSLKLSELQGLLDSVQAVLDLRDEAQALPSGEPDPDIHTKPGVNHRLDELRETFNTLDDRLQELAEQDKQELRRVQLLPLHVLSQYELLFLGQIGFLARLPHDTSTSPSSPLHGFDFKFRTDEHVFFQNETTLGLNERFGDLQGAVTDADQAIVRQVQERVASMADEVVQASKIMAELDCYLSLATAAIAHNLVRPEMSHDSVLLIRDGRHLLKEKQTDTFVANSTQLGEMEQVDEGEEEKETQQRARGKIHVITGPNNSGKTVYLKQVGIITYLAHTGSFVPAAHATVGICDRILTRLKSVESVLSNFSTFTYDTSQMSYLLRHATARSLCLVDEYGKGTANLDGISLLASVVRYLESKGPACPKALISSHFHELFSLQMLRESNLLTFWKMDYLAEDPVGSAADEDSSPANGAASHRRSSSTSFSDSSPQRSGKHRHRGEHLPNIICLYKLVPGVSKRSFGFSCAVAAGVPESLMLRAAHTANAIVSGQALEPVDLVSGFHSATLSDSSGSAPPTSSSSSSAFTRAEEELWHEFVAFVLHHSGSIRTPTGDSTASLAQLQHAVSHGELDVARAMGGLDEEEVADVFVKFMQERRASLQSIKATGALETVD